MLYYGWQTEAVLRRPVEPEDCIAVRVMPFEQLEAVVTSKCASRSRRGCCETRDPRRQSLLMSERPFLWCWINEATAPITSTP